MKNKLFVIFGARSKKAGLRAARGVRRHGREPNVDLLKQSPCLQCPLYVEGTACLYVKACSKIDEFQTVAAAHCTLYKDHDVFSVLKV